MHQTTLTFPQIKLTPRHGHKLRGYFAELFREESDLFHNHTPEGKSISRYPLIQYKVLRGEPTLVGIDKGAELLIEKFLNIKEIEIEGLLMPVWQKNMKSRECLVGVDGVLRTYEFVNPWMALNQENFKRYEEYDMADRRKQLEAILIRNMQAFMSGVGHFEKEKMLVQVRVGEVPVKFKNQRMIGFKGEFVTNVRLPNFIGLGKSVSRGFGAIERIEF